MSAEILELDGEPFLVTAHAKSRILEMCLDPQDVAACLSAPDQVVESTKYPGCHNWRYADFTLGVRATPEAYVVITAVWATQEAWRADLARSDYADRELRAHFSQTPRRTA